MSKITLPKCTPSASHVLVLYSFLAFVLIQALGFWLGAWIYTGAVLVLMNRHMAWEMERRRDR